MHPHAGNPARNEKSLAAWGAELKSVDDVKAVFAKYYKGEVATLPWWVLAEVNSPTEKGVNSLAEIRHEEMLAGNSTSMRYSCCTRLVHGCES